ncbi:MAG: hypothetical protein KQH63_07660 [Desulfobulbaceae bacterium]|nr:hypothetical protein [Desulfobulbaceae bacterium]
MKKYSRIKKLLYATLIFCIVSFMSGNCLGKKPNIVNLLKVEIQKQNRTLDNGIKQIQDFVINHDGLQRRYQVYLPPAYSDDGPELPLVLYVHGGGGNIRSAYKDKFGEATDRFGFILAVPEAVRVKKGMLATRWNGGKWKEGQCCGDADDVGFISIMIEEIASRFRVNRKRVYATGASNGGLMVNRLACELSEEIAAVATVAPTAVPESCDPSRPIAVMDIHGTGDPCNPFDGSVPDGVCGQVEYKRMGFHEVVNNWEKINGCSEESSIFYKKGDAVCYSHQCQGESEVVSCKVEKMGHTFPSGSQYFFKSVVGPVSYDIGHQQIWDFFMRHSLD